MRLILLFVILVGSVLEMRFARCEETDKGLSEEDHVPHTNSKRGCNNESLVSERGTIDFYEENFGGYAPNLHCQWTITVHPEKIVRLYLGELDIDQRCKATATHLCDSLTISDGKTGKQLASVPPFVSQRVYETTANMASIVFRSNDDNKNGLGFEINYYSIRKELKTMCGVPIQQTNFSNSDLVTLSVSPLSFPWHVNIFSEKKKEIHSCSGTIIARDAILTAAHCFDPDFKGAVYRVSAGKRSLHKVEKSEMTYDVVDILFHPNYSKTTLDNDIAIVKLSRKMDYTDAIRPVCRADARDEPPSNTVCVTTGWFDQSDRSDLTLSRVTFQSITSCNIPSETRRSNSICAGFNNPSQNVCNQRAPGGALVCQAGDQWIQYGVMSAGIGCSGSNSPGIFTNIRKYNDWISAKIGTDCGRPAIAPKIFSRIVGGSEANPNSWPWQVSIQTAKSHLCGGSIIANRWIMTASHCFNADSPKHPEEYTVVVGEHNLRLKDAFERVYSVERIFRYPELTKEFLEFDIALIYLAEDIVYSKYVKPVCLARYDFPASQRCVVTGWGKTQQLETNKADTPISDVLNELEVPFIDDATCAKALNRSNQQFFQDIKPGLTICAGYLDGSKDSCFGDSGGPLVCFNDTDGSWKQVGIVSSGWGCAVKEIPGFYTKVSAYYDWIMVQISTYPAVVNNGRNYQKQIIDGR